MSTPEEQPDIEAIAALLECKGVPWVDGELIDLKPTHEKVNPADLSSNQQIVDGNADLANHAVSAARTAFKGEWGSKAPFERREILLAIAGKVREEAVHLAMLDSVEMGKPLSSSKGDAHVAAGFIQYYAEAIDKTYGKTAPGDKGYLETQVYQPRGVVAAIIPWNFPIINAAMKAGPALAAGNSVILKPSEHGTYSSIRFAEICHEAGLPKGALNVVTGGRSISEALVAHNEVDLVTFTGSTATGATVMQTAAREGLKPVMLECGGKNPQIVFADAFDSEMGPAIAGFSGQMAMWNSGQVCVARSRMLVERSVYEPFVEAITQVCRGMKTGHPRDQDTVLGPLAFAGQYTRASDCIDAAVKQGARMVLDGRDSVGDQDGYYLGPTVFADGAKSKTLWHEEIFGPVIAIEAFDDADQAVRMANDTDYGLAATIWTNNLSNGHRVAEQIDAGTVSVMTRPAMPDGCWAGHAAEPAGQSGFGIEGGMEAMKSYTRLKATQFIY